MAGYFDEDKPAGDQAVAEPPDNTSPEATDVTKVGQAAPQGAAQARIYQGGIEYDPKTALPRGYAQQPGGQDPHTQALLGQAFSQLPHEMQQQYWADQLKLSQAEQFRMQKLRNGKSAIAEALSNKTITPEVAAAANIQLDTGLNVLQIKAMQGAAVEQQIHQQREQAALDRATQNAITVKQKNAENIDKMIAVTGIVGGFPGAPQGAEQMAQHLFVDHQGDIKEVPGFETSAHLERLQKAQEARQIREDAQTAAADKKETELQHKDKEFHAKHLDQAVKEVDATIAKGKDEKTGFDPAPWKGHESDMRRVMIDKWMKDRGFDSDRDKHVAAEAKKRADVLSKEKVPAPTVKPGTTASSVTPGAPPPSPVAESPPFKVPEEGRGESKGHPFEKIDTSTLAPEQKSAVDALKKYRDLIAEKKFPEQKPTYRVDQDAVTGKRQTYKDQRDLKKEHLQDIDDMLSVLGKYGSIANMRAQDPQQFERWQAQKAYLKKLFPDH